MSTEINHKTILRELKKKTFKDWVDITLNVLVGTALVFQLLLVFVGIVAREFLGFPILWADEMGQLALTTVAFLGGAVAYTRNEHIAVHAVVNRLPKNWRPTIDAFVEWSVFLGSAISAYFSINVIQVRWTEYTAVLGIRMGLFVIPLTGGLFLMALYSLLRLIKQKRVPLIISAVLIAIQLGLLVSINSIFGSLDASATVNLIIFTIFVFQLFVGLPVGFVLMIASMSYLYLSGRGNVSQIPMTMQNGVLSIVLIAIPFFMMAGYIMTEGGLSKRLANFVVSVVGRFRGGLLQAMIGTAYVFAGLSGSKAADVAAVGSTLNPMLKANGYDKSESSAVLAAATVMGETIPPSLPMLILGSITTISMGSLFMGGLIPAAVIGLCLMAAVYIKARLSGKYKGVKGATFFEVVKSGINAFPSLLVPIFLIGGIISGVATPTEVSTFAVIYALVLAIFVYREMSWSTCLDILVDTSAKAGMILFITSAGSAFSWTLTAAGIPDKISQLMISVAGHTDWIFMLATVIILIIMGALLEGIPALLVFAPLLVPIAPQFGIAPLQYGIVLLISMGLGAFSPPMGIGLYITCSVCGTTVEETSRSMLPYLAVLFIGLLLVAFVPWFSLVIPKLMHLI